MSPEPQQRRAELVVVLDRIEGPTAVLIDDDGRQTALPFDRLPKGTKEGDVLRVPLDHAERPDWFNGVVDPAETERRRAEARAALERLQQRDPGGDVTL
jgi:hypothetical protein